MHRIDHTSAETGSLPTFTAAGTAGYFKAPSTLAGTQGTVVTADWLNDLQENICNVITGSGGSLSKGGTTELQTAINALIAVSTNAASSALTTHAGLVSNETVRGHLEVATSTEAGNLSNNARALTPGNIEHTFEIGSNTNGNYLYLPTGVASGARYVFQWGRSTSGGENRVITLPVEMASATDYYANGTPESQANDQGTNSHSTTEITLTSSGYSGNWRWLVFGLSA